MTNFIQNRGNFSSTINTNRLLSPNIWGDCPIEHLQAHRLDGSFWFDDFHNFDPPAIAGEATDRYYGIGDTGVTILSLADQDNGVIEVAGNDADNDQSILVYGFESGVARFSPSDMVWFEARVAKASIADNALGFFLGFTEQPNIAIGSVTLQDNSADLDASEDFIGFSCLAADGDIAECVYQEGGATKVNVGDVNSALVAATYYKLGMKFDGPDGKLEYYLNGSLVQTLSVTSALSFPDENHLAMIWTTAVGTAAESKTQMDWWSYGALTL